MSEQFELSNVIVAAYLHLHQHNLVASQYAFSKDWLKKSKSYFGYLKCTGADTTPHVALNLWAECRRQKISWQSAAKKNSGSELSKALFERLADKAEQAEQYVSDAVMGKYLIADAIAKEGK